MAFNGHARSREAFDLSMIPPVLGVPVIISTSSLLGDSQCFGEIQVYQCEENDRQH